MPQYFIRDFPYTEHVLGHSDWDWRCQDWQFHYNRVAHWNLNQYGTVWLSRAKWDSGRAPNEFESQVNVQMLRFTIPTSGPMKERQSNLGQPSWTATSIMLHLLMFLDNNQQRTFQDLTNIWENSNESLGLIKSLIRIKNVLSVFFIILFWFYLFHAYVLPIKCDYWISLFMSKNS